MTRAPKRSTAGMETVTCQPGQAAASQDQVNLVYSVEPQGNVPKDRELVLTFYASLTPIGTPTAPTIEVAGAPVTTVTSGSTVQVNWSGFTCPSGTGSASAYDVSLTNGTFVADGSTKRSFGPTERPVDVLVAGTSGSLIATYTVTCTGNDAEPRLRSVPSGAGHDHPRPRTDALSVRARPGAGARPRSASLACVPRRE